MTRRARSWPTSRTSSSSSISRVARRGRRRRCRGRRRRADHLRQPATSDGSLAWKDLCRGPHLPTTRHIPAFKLMRTGGGVLARQREEPAAAAHLRHRLGVARGAQGLPDLPRGGRQARPPQARRRARPVLVPGRDRFRARRLPSQGRRHPAGDGELLAAAARGGRLLLRQLPAHHEGRPVPDLRPPAVVRRRHVPADGDGGQPSTTSSR